MNWKLQMFGKELIQIFIFISFLKGFAPWEAFFSINASIVSEQLQIASFMCEDKDWCMIDLAFFFSPCRVPEVLHSPLYRLHAQLADKSVGGRGRGWGRQTW